MNAPSPSALPNEPTVYPYTALPHLPARSALVFAPHPDDEVFGCGGLIAAWLAAGTAVQVVIVSDGAAGGDMATREAESRAAAQALAGPGGQPAALSFWRLPDRGVRADAALVQRMHAAIADSGADCVLAPSAYEIHPDHRGVSSAATLAFAQALAAGSTAQLVYFEIGHPLFANRLVDITPMLARKRAAIDCFPSQLQVQDYGEQVLALNRFRSYTLGPKVSHAEAYQVADTAALRAGLAGVVARDAAQVNWRLGLAESSVAPASGSTAP
jgi:LmbE family N-acetylglucosaminyl deacetylase